MKTTKVKAYSRRTKSGKRGNVRSHDRKVKDAQSKLAAFKRNHGSDSLGWANSGSWLTSSERGDKLRELKDNLAEARRLQKEKLAKEQADKIPESKINAIKKQVADLNAKSSEAEKVFNKANKQLKKQYDKIFTAIYNKYGDKVQKSEEYKTYSANQSKAYDAILKPWTKAEDEIQKAGYKLYKSVPKELHKKTGLQKWYSRR